jgi:multiple antibiotic resistance protein
VEIDWNLYLNFFAAMMAIINPIGIWPIWSELTNDAVSKIRKRLAFLVIMTGFVVLVIFMVSGHHLLKYFSIDLQVFKVAGGLLLLNTGISMVRGTAAHLENRKEEGSTPMSIAKQRFEKIVVPLAIPVLAGPGSITTVIIFGARAESLINYIVMIVIIFISLLPLFIAFIFSSFLEKKVDRLFFSIFTRIFGIIVTAIAVQFILEGVGEVFPLLLNSGGESPLEQS